MKETVELRNKPKLKIILNQNQFEIIDASEPKNSGIYSFVDIKKVKLNAEKTNWLFSTFTIIVDLFTGISGGGKFKDKANLEVEMAHQNLKIWLIDANFEKAKKVIEILNGKKQNLKGI